jgi:hypothetical protein
MSSETQVDWVVKVGAPAYASIAEMVAALECDYDRLEELRGEREELAEAVEEAADAHDACLDGAPDMDTDLAGELDERAEALGLWDAEHSEEFEELKEAAGDCESEEQARERIQDDALSVEVRSEWHTPGDRDGLKAAEFKILLSTGGPAVQIRGELDDHGEPSRAWLEVQDWGKPWTEYVPAGSDVLLTYSRCFFFGE